MKIKRKAVFICTITFLISFCVSFIYSFSFWGIVYRLNWISITIYLLLVCVSTLACSIAVIAYQIYRRRAKKESKFDNWISMNSHRISLYCIVSLICCISIKTDVIFSIQELRDFLSLLWSIFGITITIFLVWNVLIVDYLKKKKPSKENITSPIDKWRYIVEKGSFYKDASETFNSITMLLIELCALSFATVTAYIVWNDVNLFNQNLVIIAFYFSSNTLLDLFLGILRPLREEKKLLLKDTKISSEEVEECNKVAEKTEKLNTTLATIESSTAFDEEQKRKIKDKLMIDYLGMEQTNAEEVAK